LKQLEAQFKLSENYKLEIQLEMKKQELEASIKKQELEASVKKQELEASIKKQELEASVTIKNIELEILREKTKQMELEKCKKPDNVIDDIYLQYLDERTKKSDKHIHTSTLYSDFKKWFTKNNPKAKIPSKRIFVSGLRNHVALEQVRVHDKNTLGVKYVQLK
jgi:hypothetical protein